jgi:hypothetical protein
MSHYQSTSNPPRAQRAPLAEDVRCYWRNDSYAAHRRAAACYALGTGNAQALRHAHAVLRLPAATFRMFR